MNRKNLLRNFIAKSLAKTPEIWQMKLISERDLCNLARDRGLTFWCLDNDIKLLWQTGLLKADLIASETKLKMDKVVYLKKDEYKGYIYKDNRDYVEDEKGLAGIFKRLPEIPQNIQLLFHPFRYFVLYQIEEKLKLNFSRTQILTNPKGLNSLVDGHIKFFQEWTSSKNFREQFQEINDNTDLAVSCEPYTFQKVFGFHTIQIRHYDNPELSNQEYYEKVKEYSNDHKKILETIGLEQIKKAHSEFCIEAQSIDGNIDIHRTLRFSEKDFRLKKIKGKLGGAMYILAMAEMIRRAAENNFNIELPEEDEIGFYFGVRQSKEFRYGAQRLIDDKKARREFLRGFGLDYTIRLRWYVEGYTEFGALKSILGNHHYIELINLKGLIVAGGGKGLAFKDNLLNDLRNSIYSWVLLDTDNQDYVNVLRNSVKTEEMFGMFFLSKPDFEFDNFTTKELVEVIWQWAEEYNVEKGQKQKLIEATVTTESSSDFFKAVDSTILHQPQIKKGEVWGEKLMRYADKHPKREDTKKERHIIRAIRCALHSYPCNYQMARKDGKVDVNTGDIVYPKNK